MLAGLYFPFSRLLDQEALKQAVLVYDELLFVDPVSPEARHSLYASEARAAHVDPRITQAWLDAAANYDLLTAAGLVRTVDTAVLDPAGLDALVEDGLTVDLDMNRAAGALFDGRHRWQMLEHRVPPSALDDRFRPEPGPPGWYGEPVVQVPYAVGSSVALTYAVTIAQETGAVPVTDSLAHHHLLLMRLEVADRAERLPGLRARPPHPYRRGLIALRIADELAPPEVLANLSFDQLLDYRDRTRDERYELNDWIDRLDGTARHRPWDEDMEAELTAIAAQAREIAARPGRLRSAWAAAGTEISVGRTVVDAVKSLSAPALSAFVFPQLTLTAALMAGATAAGRNLLPAAQAAIDALVSTRTPEQNAVSYLLNAHRR